jgi:hypothetical protein
MTKLIEYEIKFRHWNILSKVHDERYDFLKASSIAKATEAVRFKYGDLIDILYVKVFERRRSKKMVENKCVVAFTENTNQSDEAISLMREVINSVADKHNCVVINDNRTTLVFTNNNDVWLDDIIDEVESLCEVSTFEFDFQSEEMIYRNLPEVADQIGSTLLFKLLNALEVNVETLDFKAIACRDYSRFYH